MKISWNWLREFVDAPLASPQDLADKLTLHTCEVEEVIDTSDKYKGVFTGKLVDFKKHPKSEKLSVALFDLGERGTVQGIFGKVHEVAVGEILPIAVAGTVLASGVEIKDGEIAGEKTQCMIADNTELGMKNEGLIRFPSNTRLGQPLSEAIEAAGDFLIDIDNKSLTHRPDLMGHTGFAREIAAIGNTTLLLPEPLVALREDLSQTVEVDIQTEVCTRFCAIKIENVTIAPSSFNTLFRLEHLGIRSISNVVDITNLIMMEHGQPMHVFDADKIQGKIIVRQALEGETLMALDGVEYTLTPQDTVVADENGVLSVAGIMGGLASGATNETKNIIFECAHWDPTAVRLTSQRLGLRSDSSMRYEKSLDRENCKRALLSATEKLLKICPKAKIVSGLTDNYQKLAAPIQITFDPDRVSVFAGVEISDKYIKETLEQLGFVIRNGGKPWTVEVPSFRATKDVSIQEDLIEEVVRMYGFENIPPKLPTLPIEPPVVNKLRQMEWHIRDFLSAGTYFEMYGYSFSHNDESHFTGSSDFVTVENPLSSEHQHLRQTLSYNLVRHIESELRTHKSCDLFELGNVFVPSKEILPIEHQKLLMCKATIGEDENALFYQIKDDFMALLRSLSLREVRFEPTEKISFLHPYKTAEIFVAGILVGHIGVLHPKFLPTKDCQMVLLEVYVDPIFGLYKDNPTTYSKLNPFPSVHRDISIVLPDRVPMGLVQRVALEASPYLERFELFDEFQDLKKLGAGYKNLAFHLSFRSREGTLDEAAIEASFESILKALKKDCEAQLRMEFDNK
ncbi:MAG TPA: phenylalanine--tRNA ligase subunit beta [Candidatus Gracilibacteria bacterium]